MRSVGAPATIEVLRLGVLDVEPARPELAPALADAERRQAKLDEALLALGVANVPAARSRHAARAEAEAAESALVARMKKLAPKGLDTLEVGPRASRTERPARFGRFQAEYTVDLDRARGTASPEPEAIAALRAP